MSNPTSIQVAEVIDQYTVVLNRGTNQGLVVGQRIVIFTLGREILDPITNKSLGELEIVKGTGQITHVQERMATVETAMKTEPQNIVRLPMTREEHMAAMTMGKYHQGRPMIEEQIPAKPIPFKNVHKGDYARPL